MSTKTKERILIATPFDTDNTNVRAELRIVTGVLLDQRTADNNEQKEAPNKEETFTPKDGYYNNVGNWIGSDGINNGKKKIVLTEATASILEEAARNNNLTTIDKSVYNDILDLPSKEFMEELDKAYSETEKTNTEYAVAETGNGKIYGASSELAYRSVDVVSSARNADETVTQHAHTHPPFVSMRDGTIYTLQYGGDAVPSDSSTTKDGEPGDQEIATALNMRNPSMVLGYLGIEEQMLIFLNTKNRDDAIRSVGNTLFNKLMNRNNIGNNLRVPVGPPFNLTRQITFYDGNNKSIATMPFEKFKEIVNKVRNHNSNTGGNP